MRCLPKAVRDRIEHRPNLIKVLENVGWLFVDKILRMGVGLVVGVWVARYLGPEQFGLFNYATALVAIFGAVATLGFNGIVVRDLIRQPPTAAPVTLGTAFTLQLLGGFVAALLIVVTAIGLRPDSEQMKVLVAILGFSLVFKASEVIRYWFESRVQSRYTVWVENGIFLMMSVVRIVLILRQASLVSFVWLVLFETILVAFGFAGVYLITQGGLNKWTFQAQRARALIRDSWPLILSGLSVMIYMRIDQVMLGKMVGEGAVGIYSAALRISEIWYMIPQVIVVSLFPAIIEAKKNDEDLYKKRMQRLLNLMALLSLAISIIMTFLADPLVLLLFGNGYAEAGGVLKIHIWASVFVFFGVAGSNWYLAENLQRLSLYRTVAGGVLNVLLNLVLIPKYGVIGAALATVVGQGMAAYLMDASSVRSRSLFFAKTRAIVSPFLVLKGFLRRVSSE
ncbi:MAG: flippase [Steroidobacteraceae bacterium]